LDALLFVADGQRQVDTEQNLPNRIATVFLI